MRVWSPPVLSELQACAYRLQIDVAIYAGVSRTALLIVGPTKVHGRHPACRVPCAPHAIRTLLRDRARAGRRDAGKAKAPHRGALLEHRGRAARRRARAARRPARVADRGTGYALKRARRRGALPADPGVIQSPPSRRQLALLGGFNLSALHAGARWGCVSY